MTSMSQESLNSPLVRNRMQSIVNRAIKNVRARTGCQCRITTEIVVTRAGDFRVRVLAIYPCRRHMGSSQLTESLLASDIESEANRQITRAFDPVSTGLK
jgi:hypothetical protein